MSYFQVFSYTFTDVAGAPVVDGVNGHVAFVEQGLLVEHLHQSAYEFRQSFFLDGFEQQVFVDGVAIEFAGELDEVEQERLFFNLADHAHQVVGLIALVFTDQLLDGLWPLIVLGEVGGQMVCIEADGRETEDIDAVVDVVADVLVLGIDEQASPVDRLWQIGLGPASVAKGTGLDDGG